MQQCTKCHLEKPFDSFCYRNKGKGTRSIICKSCQNDYAKKYRQDNVDKIKTRQKEWYDSSGHLWKQDYCAQKKEHQRSYEKKRYHEDPEYRMKKILRTRFHKLVNKDAKSQRMIAYVGIDISLFMTWIETQFVDGMSWDNVGKVWEFDHVIPCKAFHLSNEEDVRICFRWNNIQPLFKSHNYSKGAKIDVDMIAKHKEKVSNFERKHPGTKAIWKHIAGVE